MAMVRKQPNAKPLLAVCGDTGLKEHSGIIREEFHPHLRGDKWLKVAQEMGANESNIASPHLVIEMLIRNSPRTIRPNDSGHPRANEAADYISECWEDMDSTPQEVLTDATTALQWGYAYQEIELKIRKGDNDEPLLRSQFSDGRYGWRDFSPRAQQSREYWHFDEAGRLMGMWQRSERRPELLFIPRDRACHYRFRGQKQNPEGLSFYRAAYTSYYYAKRMRETEAISMERNGAGLPDFQVPPEIMDPNASTEQKAVRTAIESFVRKIRFDQIGGVVRPSELDRNNNPTGYKFGLVASSGRNGLEFDAPIKRYQNEMLKSFLTQFLAFGISQEGSHALSSDMTSMLGFAVGAINKVIDQEITRSAISTLMRLEGFPEDSWPWMESADVESPKLSEAGSFIGSMISSGAMAPDKDVDNWARKQIGLEAKEGDEVGDLMSAFVDAQPQAQTSAAPAGPLPEGQLALPLAEQAPDEPLHPMMSADEAAEFLNVDRKKIMRSINSGRLPGIKIGNDFRIKREDLDRLMAAGVL